MDERLGDVVDRRHRERAEAAPSTFLYGNLEQTRDEVGGLPRAGATVPDDPADPVHGGWDPRGMGAADHYLRNPLALGVAGRQLLVPHRLVVLRKHLA